MKKSILTLGLMFTFAFIMFLGTTYAYFSKTVTVYDNVIQSGSMLDVEYNVYVDGTWVPAQTNKIFNANDLTGEAELWPGESLTKYVQIYNPNDRPVAITMETFGNEGNISFLDIAVALNETGNPIGQSLDFFPIADFDHFYIEIPANSTRQFTVKVTLEPDVTLENGYFSFDITFTATQVEAKLAEGAVELFE